MPEERMRILEMIESGKISAEEGVLLLKAVLDADERAAEELEVVAPVDNLAEAPVAQESTQSNGQAQLQAAPSLAPVVSAAADPGASAEAPEVIGEAVTVTRPSSPPLDTARWRYWWLIILAVGLAVAVPAGFFMYLAYQYSGVNFWFVCATMPFLLGALIIVLAFQSRAWPWLHLRVQQPPGESPQRIAISFPIPVRPAAWLLRIFSRFSPELRDRSIDEILLAVGESTSPENPIYIEVDDDDGEHVQIYIG